MLFGVVLNIETIGGCWVIYMVMSRMLSQVKH